MTARIKQCLLSFMRLLASRPTNRRNLPEVDTRAQDNSAHYRPPPSTATQRFQQELFAELLLELPAQRCRLAESYGNNDYRALRHVVHQLLGAVSYCDTPDFEFALKDFLLAIKADEQTSIDRQYAHTLSALDNILALSGINHNRSG